MVLKRRAATSSLSALSLGKFPSASSAVQSAPYCKKEEGGGETSVITIVTLSIYGYFIVLQHMI